MSRVGRSDEPQVLYADNHLLVVHKPAGMPAQGDASGDLSLLDWAKAWIKRDGDKPGEVFVGLVHRLDRPTSGVMALARTSKAASRLSAAVRERRTHKRYLARCEAAPRGEEGLLEAWIVPGTDGRSSHLAAPGALGAQQAALRWRRLDRETTPLLSIELLTGRKHQIRVQLAAVGAPIVGDLRYGARAVGADACAPPPWAIALHAFELTLPHPIGGTERTFRAEPPPWIGATAAILDLPQGVASDVLHGVARPAGSRDDD